MLFILPHSVRLFLEGVQTSVTQSSFDLQSLFGAALQAMADNRQQINDLDGYNGNHGDNMVENLRIITEAVQGAQAGTPAEALHSASQQLQARGRGGTSPYYAQGFEQAASQFQGREQLGMDDVLPLLQMLLSAVPDKGGPPQPAAQAASGEDALASLLGAASGGPPRQSSSVLEDLLGMAAGQAAQPQPQRGEAGDLMEQLLPAAMTFLQAKQGGADNATAGGQALLGALLGGAVAPTQASSPRTAAGGLLAQSILKAVFSK